MSATTTTRKKAAPKWAYQSCRDLLLSVFIDCYCESNLSGLGGPEGERKAHWEAIKLEYYDLSGGGVLSATMHQVKEAQILAARISRVTATLNLLRQFWHPVLVAELRIDYPMLKLNCADNSSYEADLVRIEALLKKDTARLINLQEDMKPKKGKKEAPATYDTFASNCIELSKYQGYNIDPETTTVLKYCLCLSKLNKQIETVNRQIEQQQNGR